MAVDRKDDSFQDILQFSEHLTAVRTDDRFPGQMTVVRIEDSCEDT